MESEQSSSPIEPNPYEVPYPFLPPPPPKNVNTVRLWVCVIMNIVFFVGGLLVGAVITHSLPTASHLNPQIHTTETPTLQVSNLPTAIQLVSNYKPSQEYAYVTWKSSASPSQYDMTPYPQSYAQFDVCFGAGGSGCTTVLYTLAIYQDVTVIAQLTPEGNNSFEWSATLGHCVLQAQNDVHSDFLSVENDFSRVEPC